MDSELFLTEKKVLLHTHIEGSLTVETVFQLLKQNSIKLPSNWDINNLKKYINKNDWNTFRKIYYCLCSLFQTERDYYVSLLNYGIKLSKEKVSYAEVHFSPWRHLSRGIEFDQLYIGFERAIDVLEDKYKIKIRLICDIVRKPDEQINKISDWIISNPNTYIKGIGISGGINSIPRINYKNFCDKFSNLGYGITVHAGEIEGIESIVESVEILNAARIVHGIALVKSPDKYCMFSNKNIHFELCPSANECIGIGEKNYESIRKMVSLVDNYSINTDDELIFNTNLNSEYEKLFERNLISQEDFFKSQKNAIKSSFADSKTKENLLRYFAKCSVC